MARFPGPEWLDLYVGRINASPEYADAAATWEGDVVFVYGAEPDRGVPEDVYAWLDLWHGTCREAAILAGPDDPRAVAATFTISAPYSRWKAVLTKELDPIKGMMQGTITVRGDLPTVVRHVKAANVLVDLTSEVPTEFPDA
jgi:putative sterol carrier protein